MRILLLLALATLLTNCATIYEHPDLKKIASKHKNIAILPSTLIIINPDKDITSEMLKTKELAKGKIFQQEIYTYLLKTKSKSDSKIIIQDIKTTNILLKRKKHQDISETTAEELYKTLEVDAFFYSNFSVSKPMSEGGAIVSTIFLGSGTTNEVLATVNLTDGATDELLWEYNHKMSGGIGSSESMLVENLMRDAASKMPYFKKKKKTI